MAESYAQISMIAAAVFGIGVCLGLLLYRAIWHVDTALLRQEISDLRVRNRVLTDELIRLSSEVSSLQERLSTVEAGARETQQDLHASLRR